MPTPIQRRGHSFLNEIKENVQEQPLNMLDIAHHRQWHVEHHIGEIVEAVLVGPGEQDALQSGHARLAETRDHGRR